MPILKNMKIIILSHKAFKTVKLKNDPNFFSSDQDPSTSYVGEKATISGWGEKEQYLRAMEVQVIDQNNCKTKFATANVNITDAHICMFKKNESPSQGDSGGKFTFVPQPYSKLYTNIPNGIVNELLKYPKNTNWV